MRKTLIASALAASFASPALVLAADPVPEHSFTPNVGVVSDYLFRGVSQTRGKPALQGGIDYAHSSGLYAGIWGSSITWVKDWLGKGSTEVDLYAGFKNSFADDWTYDVGVIRYQYPGKGASTKGNGAVFAQLADPNTTEVYGAIGYKWITVKYSQAVSKHFIGWVPTTAAGADATRNSKGSNYLEINAAYDLGEGWGLTGHIGHQKVKNVVATTGTAPVTASADYTDWNIGVTKDVGFGVVGVAYSDTNAKGSCANPFPAAGTVSAYCWGAGMNQANGAQSGFKDVAKGTLVLSFKKTF